MSALVHSAALREFVAAWEVGPDGGPALRAYNDLHPRDPDYDGPEGVWTLGYGHTRRVRRGDTCTRAQAEAWLDAALAASAFEVSELVRVPLEQRHVDALTSFVYNVGSNAFAQSQLRSCVNGVRHEAAAAQLLRWNKAGGRVLRGLLARRAGEALIYAFGDYGGR